jgi:AcrR family transcriptional regulator
MSHEEDRVSARERLLVATLEIADELGIARATTRQIAERAGANLQLIQYYFGGKDGLIEEAEGYILERFFAELGPAVAGAKSLDEAIRRGIAVTWDLTRSRPAMVQPDLLLQSVRAGRMDRSRAFPRRTHVRVEELLQTVMDATGDRLAMPLRPFVLILIAGLSGLVLEYRVTQDAVAIGAAMDGLADVMAGLVVP